jgi:hypothetical protein
MRRGLHNVGTEQLASSKGDAQLIYDTSAAWIAGLWIKNMTNKAVIAAAAAGILQALPTSISTGCS